MAKDKSLQNPGAEAENKAVTENRTALLRSKNQGVAILPGGRRVSAAPFMHVRYDMQNEANILGDPERMLTEDWKRDHQGWHYQWPIRTSDQTAALLRAGWFVAVPYEAIDHADPMAAIADVKTPGGHYVVWKQHLLVGVPPDKFDKLVTQWEHLAISRTVMQAETEKDRLDSMFGAGGFEAEVKPFINQRQNKTGD